MFFYDFISLSNRFDMTLLFYNDFVSKLCLIAF